MKIGIMADEHTEQFNRQLMDNIRAVGIEIQGIGLLSTLPAKTCRKALPALEKALGQPIDLDLRMVICEAIALWAKAGIAVPLAQFKLMLPEIDDDWVAGRAWQLGSIILDATSARDKDHVDDLKDVILDPRFGKARQMLPYALAKIKSKREEAIETLIKALALDDDITPQVISSLRKLKATEAADAIMPFATHRWRLVETQARKALKAFGVTPEDPKPVGIKVTRKRLKWEASINLDPENVPVLLGMVNDALTECGNVRISEHEVTAITQAFEELEDGQIRRFEFLLETQGPKTQSTEVRIRIEMSCGDEFYVFSDSKDLILTVTQAIRDRWM